MKLIKGLIGFILGILIFIVVCVIVTFIYHKISNKIYEEKYYKVPGDLIEVYDGEKIHASKFGEGEYTIIMLPGMGTPSPYYDYYNLAKSLSEKNTVIIIEPLGYGYSTNTLKERTLENYTYEINKVLEYYNVEKNIVLLAHSYSGPITMNYANNNTNVVGYVCLDCTSAYQAEVYVNNNTEIPSYPDYYKYIAESGILRLIGIIGGDKLLNQLYLNDVPDEFRNDYEYFIYNKTLNETIINELRGFPIIEKEMLYKKYRDDLHVITYLATDTIDTMNDELKNETFLHGWEEMHELMRSNESIQTINILEGEHYIYHGKVEEITNGINDMIASIS